MNDVTQNSFTIEDIDVHGIKPEVEVELLSLGLGYVGTCCSGCCASSVTEVSE